MARQEHDREDLLREATAMVERASVRVAFWPEPVFVGFRRSSSLSIYFGGDPVYQFNAAGELRRAFVDGLLYKAEGGRLIEIRRERTEQETRLVSRELSDAEAAALTHRMDGLLKDLRDAMQGEDASKLEVLGEFPPGANVVGRVEAWLTQRVGKIAIAATPRA
jgi:hypothetical protein